MALRVDNVPWYAKPAFHAYGYGSGALLQATTALIRRGCRFERSESPTQGPRIECIWHEHLPTYIASYLPPRAGRRYAWLNHPIWYMRGVHVLLGWNGVHDLVLGSTGHDGQRALARLVRYLQDGYSTLVAVDGPSGPRQRVKRGALDMAVASGCPIVPIAFDYERCWRAPGWDGKRYPVPGSRVWIREAPPIDVGHRGHEPARAELAARLGA